MRNKTLFLAYIELREEMVNIRYDRGKTEGILVSKDSLALKFQKRHRQAYKIAGRLLENMD